MSAWLTVIGIGDDGLHGLSPAARALVASAELLVGGERHQAMVADTSAQRLTWEGGIDQASAEIARWRGRRVVVLATGDPMWFGGGANLAKRFDAAEMTVIPAPGAFSLAASRMLWPLADVETVSVHGRPLASLSLYLQPGARLLVLSRDGETPAQAAALLVARGFGESRITVLEHLGGPSERRFEGIAGSWQHGRAADLNTLAIECRADAGTAILPRLPGLPDEAFETDGQLTKREVRALTISALAPLPGQILWDVGAGSGSIAIEWLRVVPACAVPGRGAAKAVAVERKPERAAIIARNAEALGVPELEVVLGEAPACLGALTPPDAVFVGGGIAAGGVIEACWARLRQGGRLVANAVTLEGTARLTDFRRRYGGELSRLAVARADAVGPLSAFRPAMEVVQFVATKG